MNSGYDQFFKKVKMNAEFTDSSVKQSDSIKLSDLIRKQRKEAQKNKKKFPIYSFFSFGICVIGMFFLIEKFDSIETFLNKIELGLGPEIVKASAEKVEKKADSVQEVSVQAKSNDDTEYLLKLAERKKQLDSKEEELNKQATEIAKQKTEIEEKLNSLEKSREKIASLLKERIATDTRKVETLVQVYSNMKANQAAKIFETMDEDLVIDILSRMKKKNAADILNLVKSDKAQVLSEKYAGYRSPASKNTDKEELLNEESKPKP